MRIFPRAAARQESLQKDLGNALMCLLISPPSHLQRHVFLNAPALTTTDFKGYKGDWLGQTLTGVLTLPAEILTPQPLNESLIRCG